MAAVDKYLELVRGTHGPMQEPRLDFTMTSCELAWNAVPLHVIAIPAEKTFQTLELLCGRVILSFPVDQDYINLGVM